MTKLHWTLQQKSVCNLSVLRSTRILQTFNVFDQQMLTRYTINSSVLNEIVKRYSMTHRFVITHWIHRKKQFVSMQKIQAVMTFLQYMLICSKFDWMIEQKQTQTTTSWNKQCDSLDNIQMMTVQQSKSFWSIETLLDIKINGDYWLSFSCAV
jgi:hypothetical protein